MSIKKIKIFCIMAILLICSLGGSSELINAAKYDFYESATDSDSTYGTTGQLSVGTTLDVDVPLIASCSIRSKGSSNTKFKKNGVSCQRTFKKHSITAKIGGVGGGSISTSEIGLSTGSNKETFKADTYNWNYTIYSDIFKLFSYNEVHTVSYKIKKGDRSTTVTMSGKVKYC